MFTPYTKKLLPLIFLSFCVHTLFAADDKTDSLKQQLQIKLGNVDSLKQKLDITTSDSLKAPLYSQIASEYLKYDTLSNKEQRRAFQNAAIKNTLSAIRIYSRYNDTVGLRMSFDVLAKVYHALHKYPQAKWFILQSNTLSRAKNDNPNIIGSLIE